jgi:hypothetical protein
LKHTHENKKEIKKMKVKKIKEIINEREKTESVLMKKNKKKGWHEI